MNNISRDCFMQFFRDDEKLNLLTNDDRIEIFLQILSGGSDITDRILTELLTDYQVNNLKISHQNDG